MHVPARRINHIKGGRVDSNPSVGDGEDWAGGAPWEDSSQG